MVYKTEVIITDDLTGETLDEHQTIRFGLDMTEYEIDLSQDNADEFRGMVRRYIDAGRKQKTSRTRNRKAKK